MSTKALETKNMGRDLEDSPFQGVELRLSDCQWFRRGPAIPGLKMYGGITWGFGGRLAMFGPHTHNAMAQLVANPVGSSMRLGRPALLH